MDAFPNQRRGCPQEPFGTKWEEDDLDSLFPKLTAKIAELEDI